MRLIGIGVAAVALLAACGNTDTERMLTGGATGATAGAVLGGPAGLLLGGLAGAAGGVALEQSVMETVNLDFFEDEIETVEGEVEEVIE